MELQYVIIQDAPWFMKAYPTHPMWELYPFCDPAFHKWAGEHMAKCEDVNNTPPDLLISRLQLSHASQTAQLVRQNHSDVLQMKAKLTAMETMLVQSQTTLASFTTKLDGLITGGPDRGADGGAAGGGGRDSAAHSAAASAADGAHYVSALEMLTNPEYENTMGNFHGRVAVYKGRIRWLTLAEVPLWTGFANMRQFFVWFAWGASTHPPAKSVIEHFGRRHLMDGTLAYPGSTNGYSDTELKQIRERRTRQQHSNNLVVLWFLLLNRAVRYRQGGQSEKLELAAISLDQERRGLSMYNFWNTRLRKSQEWQSAVLRCKGATPAGRGVDGGRDA